MSDEPKRPEASAPRIRSGLRASLLGAAATLAIVGAAANGFGPHGMAAAHADTVQTVNPTSFADVVDHVRGAVVSVKVKISDTTASNDDDESGMPQFAPGDPLERFFRRFGEQQNRRGNGAAPKPHTSQAQGSGFFISSDGYLVTNNHVVENATDVTITMDDGKTLPAKVVGTDKKTDLALLKASGEDFPHVDFARTAPRVGDWVIAVGNPFGLGGTVTAGIVSARGRDIGAGPYDDFLQIDAPVNRGNSGGPTFNGAGQVVGVNTAIFSPSGGSVGIGFAIPAEVAQNVISSLKDKGSVARGWIGVQIQPVTSDIADSMGLKSTKGALVAEAQSNAPAAQAGIKSGDIILGVDGDKIEGPRELARKIASLGPNASAQIAFWHEGSEHTVAVKLGNLPNDLQAKADAGGDAGTNSKTSLASLGLELAPAASLPGVGKEGVVVSDIDPEGAAAQKGLKVGDVILEASGKPVSRPSDVTAALNDAKKDGRKAVLLRVKTGDNTHYVAVATTAKAG